MNEKVIEYRLGDELDENRGNNIYYGCSWDFYWYARQHGYKTIYSQITDIRDIINTMLKSEKPGQPF